MRSASRGHRSQTMQRLVPAADAAATLDATLHALRAWPALVPQLVAGLAHPAAPVQLALRRLLERVLKAQPADVVFAVLAGSLDGEFSRLADT